MNGNDIKALSKAQKFINSNYKDYEIVSVIVEGRIYTWYLFQFVNKKAVSSEIVELDLDRKVLTSYVKYSKKKIA